MTGPATAVVTGAANGIGRALARLLGARGMHVALVDVDGDALAMVERELPGATSHVVDVSDADAVERARDDIVRRHGRIHLLVNNAGISVAGPVESVPLGSFRRALDVNFWGTVLMCRALLPELRSSASRGEPAAICNVLSDFALFSLPTKAPYASSKHAARALTEALAAELAGTGVSVTAVFPGATATGIVARGHAVDAAKQRSEAEFLAKGLAPESVARAILDGIDRRRSRVLVGRDTRVIDLATRVAPSLVQAGIRRFWRRVPFL